MNCQKEPAANRELVVNQIDEDGFKTGTDELARGTTDESGRFVLKFETKKDGPISIRGILTEIPVESLDLGDLYVQNYGKAYFFLNPSQSYSSNDTLYLLGAKHAGPFDSSVPIDSISDNITSSYTFSFDRLDEFRIRWAINPDTITDYQREWFKLSGCNVIDSFFLEF